MIRVYNIVVIKTSVVFIKAGDIMKEDPKFVESRLRVKPSDDLEKQVRAELEDEKEEKSMASLISESGVCPKENNEA